MKRTVKHPRGYLRDSGLLHALLRIPDGHALRQFSARGADCECSYYRTGAGAEVDLVIEGNFGLVAVEIKHTSTVTGRDLRGLRDFMSESKARLGVVINNDVAARLYEKDLIGLPFTWL